MQATQVAQAARITYRPATLSRPVAALASIAVSASLLGAVLAGFGVQQADAATVARVSASSLG
jgi:hypothetical protein